MILWHASELHTHTVHSDGDLTVEELCRQAALAGYDTLALTDHNTISGHRELLRLAPRYGLHAIRGMEWTTYFGHMVTHGTRHYVDWHIGREEIHAGIANVHGAGGIAGVAHPFTIGEPYCLGCHWHFTLSDWEHPDYIEVWNGEWAPLQYRNQKAYQLWTEKLNEGLIISAAAGRDWHSTKAPHTAVPVTYVGVEDDRLEDYEAGWLEGMRKGRISVSFGPLLLIQWKDPGGPGFGLGDRIDRRRPGAMADVLVTVDFDRRNRMCPLDDEPLELRLVGSTGILWQTVMNAAERAGTATWDVSVDTHSLKWLRGELEGSMEGRRQMVAFTNPIYIR